MQEHNDKRTQRRKSLLSSPATLATPPASTECAPSHVKVAAKSLKQFLDEAAAEKHRHYDALATNAKATFVAFVVEANGSFGDEALQHIKLMIRAAQRQSYVWAPAQAVNTVYRAI